MATPMFPDLVAGGGQAPPAWLLDAIDKANALMAPKVESAPQAPGLVPPPALVSQAPAPAPALGNAIPKLEEPALKPITNYGALDATLPKTGVLKNSRQAADAEGVMRTEAVKSSAAQQEYLSQADQAVKQGQAQAQEEYVAGLDLNSQQYQADQAKSRETAAKKTEALDMDIKALADQEPDHTRWWSNRSTGSKIALMIGALGHALGSNPAGQSHTTNMILKFMDEDIAEQKEAVAKKLALAKEKKEEVRLTRAEELAAAGDTFKMKMTRLDAVDKQLQLQAQTLGAEPRRRAQVEAARSTLAQQRAGLLHDQGAQFFSREQQAAAFAHDERKQRLAWAHEERQAAIKAQGEGMKDLRVIPPEMSNLKVVKREGEGKDSKLVPTGNRVLHKDYVEGALDTTAKANESYRLAKSILKQLKAGDNVDMLLANNPKFNQDFQRLAGIIATDPNFNKGSTTDPDYRRGGDISLGRLADEGWLAKGANFKRRKEMAVEAISYMMEKLPESTNNQLRKFPTPDGGSLYWEPPVVEEPRDNEAAKKYMTQQEQDAELANAGSVTTGRGMVSRGTNLPPMSEAQVAAAQEAEQAGVGATSAGMVAEAKARLFKGAETPEAKADASAALKRFIRANEKTLDEARAKELEAATSLANAYLGTLEVSRFSTGPSTKKALDSYAGPSARDIREAATRATLSPGKLAKEDFDHISKLTLDILKQKLGQR